MTFEFSHDGRRFLLHTEAGEAACDPIDPQPAPPPQPPLEPSDDVIGEAS